MRPVTSVNGGEGTSGELQGACLRADGRSSVAKSENAATRPENLFLTHVPFCVSLPHGFILTS